MKSRIQERINELQGLIQESEASLPAHSIPPAMLMRLETWEEELAELQALSELEAEEK